MRTILLAPALFSSEGGIERMMRLYLKALCLKAGPDDNVTLVVDGEAFQIPAASRRGKTARLTITSP